MSYEHASAKYEGLKSLNQTTLETDSIKGRLVTQVTPRRNEKLPTFAIVAENLYALSVQQKFATPVDLCYDVKHSNYLNCIDNVFFYKKN